MSRSPQHKPFPRDWEVRRDLKVGNNLTVKGDTVTEVDETVQGDVTINGDLTVQGSTNLSTNDLNHVHSQDTSSDTWEVNHGLGKFPSVTIVDSAGNEVEGEVEHVDKNNATLRFSAAFTGEAYFN